jgi:hypothetical protein
MERVREVFACAAAGKHPGAARRDDGLMAAFLPGPSEPDMPPPQQWSAAVVGAATGERDAAGDAPQGMGAPDGGPAHWADAQWDRGSVSVLTALGFAEHHVRSALTAHSGSLDLAMAYLCAEEMEREEGEGAEAAAVSAPRVDGVGHRDDQSAGKRGVRAAGDGLFSCVKPSQGKDAAYRKLDEPEPESATAARAVVMRGCASRQVPGPSESERRPVLPVALAPPSPPPAVVGQDADAGLRGGELLGGIDEVPRMTDPRFGWSNDHPDYARAPASPPHLTN